MTVETPKTTAWIFQPAPSAMQSGRRRRMWRLEFDPRDKQRPTPLMGWIGGADMDQQLGLRFPTKEAAIAYAERRGIPYRVEPPPHQQVKPKAYADNFMPRAPRG